MIDVREVLEIAAPHILLLQTACRSRAVCPVVRCEVQ